MSWMTRLLAYMVSNIQTGNCDMCYFVLTHGNTQVNCNEITICLMSKLERGKMNKELVQKLASNFEVSKDNVRIVAGLTTTKKLVEIQENNNLVSY
jgi:uncharacterized protein YggU (UPF0235/DUF167 family)